MNDLNSVKKAWAARRKTIQPEPVDLSPEGLISLSHFGPEQPLPLIIRPRVEGVRLPDWVKNNLPYIETHLSKYGGILFRGFDVTSQADFEEFLASVPVPLMEYLERSTPRAELGKGIYTSTEFPADQSIVLHNELSAAMTIPMKVWFYCLQPAEQGGETPIADVRKVFERIPPNIREQFIQKGWLLIRNYGDGFGLPWQCSFQTTEKSVVEEYCRSNAMELEWKDGDRLRTYQVRPAVAKHPRTGEMVWLNHIAFWHTASLSQEVHETLAAEFEEVDFPYYIAYGDGSRIEDAVIDHLREAYQQEMVVFSWEAGDVLMLDNMLVAHGRKPYQGTRKILVAMGEPYKRPDIRM
jgi:alpha-ketoglutarate-dependent taurine dioxygenase